MSRWRIPYFLLASNAPACPSQVNIKHFFVNGRTGYSKAPIPFLSSNRCLACRSLHRHCQPFRCNGDFALRKGWGMLCTAFARFLVFIPNRKQKTGQAIGLPQKAAYRNSLFLHFGKVGVNNIIIATGIASPWLTRLTCRSCSTCSTGRASLLALLIKLFRQLV